jgi:hypothetical protein
VLAILQQRGATDEPAAAGGVPPAPAAPAKGDAGAGGTPRAPGAAAPAGADEGTHVAASGGGPPPRGGPAGYSGVELVLGASGGGPGAEGGAAGAAAALLPEPGPEPDYRSPAVGLLGAAGAGSVASGGAAPPDAASKAAVAEAEDGGDVAVDAAARDQGQRAEDQQAEGREAEAEERATATAADEINVKLRAAAAAAAAAAPPRAAAPLPPHPYLLAPEQREVMLRLPGAPGRAAAALPGTLTVPVGATGIVLFAHGSGSGRLSPRNRLVAGQLNNVSGTGESGAAPPTETIPLPEMHLVPSRNPLCTLIRPFANSTTSPPASPASPRSCLTC